jgi:hypothetical protein
MYDHIFVFYFGTCWESTPLECFDYLAKKSCKKLHVFLVAHPKHNNSYLQSQQLDNLNFYKVHEKYYPTTLSADKRSDDFSNPFPGSVKPTNPLKDPSVIDVDLQAYTAKYCLNRAREYLQATVKASDNIKFIFSSHGGGLNSAGEQCVSSFDNDQFTSYVAQHDISITMLADFFSYIWPVAVAGNNSKMPVALLLDNVPTIYLHCCYGAAVCHILLRSLAGKQIACTVVG